MLSNGPYRSAQAPTKTMSEQTPTAPHRPGYRLIFRPVITLRNGKKLHAASKGLKAWPIWVRDDESK